MYNFIIVICLILFIFLMSADSKITKDIVEKNSIHIILFLLLIYFIYNNLHLGFLLLILILFIIYYTNFRTFLLSHLSTYEGFKQLISSFQLFFYGVAAQGEEEAADVEEAADEEEEAAAEEEAVEDEEMCDDYVEDEDEDEATNEILRTIHEELSK